jgi:hypothetical protein
MNVALGTTKAHWQPLTDARKVAAHQGPLVSPNPSTPNRNDLLGLARGGVEGWLMYLDTQPESHEPPPIEAIATVTAKRATTVSGWTP